MRHLVLLFVASCAGRSAIPAPITAREIVPFGVSPANQAKLSSYILQQWRDAGLPTAEYTAIIVTTDGRSGVAAEMLTVLGAHHVAAVTTEHGQAGTLHARAATGPSNQLFAMLPNEALRFVIGQPWAVRLDGAASYPSGPDLPDEVERRLSPELRSALARVGRERPYSVGGIAKARGCLDDAKRAELLATGAIVNSVLPHPSCEHTIFTFEVPLARLVALASFPFIMKIEGGGHMHLEGRDHE